MRRIELGLPHRAYLRIAVSAIPIGLALFAFVRAWHVLYGEGEPWFRPERHAFGLAAMGAIAAAIAAGTFSLRERGAHVTWDEHGITEWIGGAPRIAIAWRDALLSRLSVRVRSRGGTYDDGGIEQWADAGGRIITIASTSHAMPDWLLRRRCVGTTGAIHPPTPARSGEGIVVDLRGMRSVSWTTWPLRIGYATLAYYAMAVLDDPRATLGEPLWPVAAIVTAPLLLRAIRPAIELAKIARAGRATRGARRVELIGAEGTVLLAREADGSLVSFDTAPLHHDDALLATRRGLVWIVATHAPRSASEGAGPFRDPAGSAAPPTAIAVERLEHDGIRRARRALMRAVQLELAARIVLALIPFVATAALGSAIEPRPY